MPTIGGALDDDRAAAMLRLTVEHGIGDDRMSPGFLHRVRVTFCRWRGRSGSTPSRAARCTNIAIKPWIRQTASLAGWSGASTGSEPGTRDEERRALAADIGDQPAHAGFRRIRRHQDEDRISGRDQRHRPCRNRRR